MQTEVPYQGVSQTVKAMQQQHLILVIQSSGDNLLSFKAYVNEITPTTLVSEGTDYLSMRSILRTIDLALAVIQHRNKS